MGEEPEVVPTEALMDQTKERTARPLVEEGQKARELADIAHEMHQRRPEDEAVLKQEERRQRAKQDRMAKQALATIAAVDADPTHVAVDAAQDDDERTEFDPAKAQVIAQVTKPEQDALAEGTRGLKRHGLERMRQRWERKAAEAYERNPDVQASEVREAPADPQPARPVVEQIAEDAAKKEWERGRGRRAREAFGRLIDKITKGHAAT
jgi:hypothetical protein